MFFEKIPLPPKKLLHYVCFFCLVAWGISATVVASHVGSMAAWFEWTRQLAMLSFFGLLTFGFFYIEWVAVERVAGRELNENLGHIRPAVPSRAPSTTPQKIAATFDWSSSPTVIFSVAAAFFVLAGIFLIVKSPARMPLMKDGALTYVSPGYLWLPLAIPFGVFAVIYWLIEIFTGHTFDRSATRLHFLCTTLAVLDAIRVYWSWSVTTSNMHSELPGAADFFGVFAFLALATGALVWNIRASSAPHARPALRSAP